MFVLVVLQLGAKQISDRRHTLSSGGGGRGCWVVSGPLSKPNPIDYGSKLFDCKLSNAVTSNRQADALALELFIVIRFWLLPCKDNMDN